MAKKKESEIDSGDLVGEEASKFLDEVTSDTTEPEVYNRKIEIIKEDDRPIYRIIHASDAGLYDKANQSAAAVIGYLRKALYNGLK